MIRGRNFADEIDGWIIDLLKNIGCDSTLCSESECGRTGTQKPISKEETVNDVLDILRKEFDE